MKAFRILSITALWMMVIMMALALFSPNTLPTYLIPGSGQFLSVFSTSRPTVTINVESVDTKVWPVEEAVSIMNHYTGSQLVIGTCEFQTRCIRFQEDPGMPMIRVGLTRDYGNFIDLSTRARNSLHSVKLGLLVHELGHAFGIHTHNEVCTSAMFRTVTCPTGGPLPLAFTPAEQEILKVH